MQNFISSRDGPEKVQKQGNDEKIQEDFITTVQSKKKKGRLLVTSQSDQTVFCTSRCYHSSEGCSISILCPTSVFILFLIV